MGVQLGCGAGWQPVHHRLTGPLRDPLHFPSPHFKPPAAKLHAHGEALVQGLAASSEARLGPLASQQQQLGQQVRELREAAATAASAAAAALSIATANAAAAEGEGGSGGSRRSGEGGSGSSRRSGEGGRSPAAEAGAAALQRALEGLQIEVVSWRQDVHSQLGGSSGSSSGPGGPGGQGWVAQLQEREDARWQVGGHLCGWQGFWGGGRPAWRAVHGLAEAWLLLSSPQRCRQSSVTGGRPCCAPLPCSSVLHQFLY